MRFIIKESRLEKVIDKYLTMSFGELTPVEVRPGKVIYKNDNDIIRLIVYYGDTIHLDCDIIEPIFTMFGLNTGNELEYYLIRWFKNHLNLNISYYHCFEDN